MDEVNEAATSELAQAISDAEKEYESKLLSCQSNDFVSFQGEIPNIKSILEYGEEKDEMITKMKNYSSLFKPDFYYLQIYEKFRNNKDFPEDSKQNLLEYYKQEHQKLLLRKEIIMKRLNNKETYTKYYLQFSAYLKSLSEYLEFVKSAIIQLSLKDTKVIPAVLNESAIKFELLHNEQVFCMKNIMHQFKLFPLLKRREIFSTAFRKLSHDLTLNDISMSSVLIEPEQMIQELQRLSNLVGIEFDLDKEDGQHFMYSVDKIHSHSLKNVIKFPEQSKFGIKSEENPDIFDLLNNMMIKTVSIEEKLIEGFKNIYKPNGIYNETIIRKMTSHGAMNEHVQCIIKLRSVRNKNLLISIFEKLNILQDIYHTITGDNKYNFVSKHFYCFKKQLMTYSSLSIQNTKQDVDIDFLIEKGLLNEFHYLEAKEKMANTLLELHKHKQTEELNRLIIHQISQRPDLLFKPFKSIDQPYIIAIETINLSINVIQSIIILQILAERQFGSIYSSSYPSFTFARQDNVYPNQPDCFCPTSVFEMFENLSYLTKLFSTSDKIIKSLTETAEINEIPYKRYIKYAVWHELQSELRSKPFECFFISGFSSIEFDLPISEEIQKLLISPYLDDPSFISKLIADVQDSRKDRFSLSLRKLHHYGWKLRKYVAETNKLLPIYLNQKSEACDLNEISKEIKFVGGSFDFSNIDELREYCLIGDFSKLSRIVNSQRLYNLSLKVSILFNTFRSDNIFFRGVINPTEDSLLFVTKSITDNNIDSPKYESIAKMMLLTPNNCANNDFSTIFCSVSLSNDFSNGDELLKIYGEILCKTELALINQLERRTALNYASTDNFVLNQNLVNVDGSVSHFSIPSLPSVLSLSLEEETLQDLIQLTSIRLRLMNLMQYQFGLSRHRNKFLEQLYNHEVLWDSTFFSSLISRIGANEQSSNIKTAVFLFQSQEKNLWNKMNLCIMAVLDEVFSLEEKEATDVIRSIKVNPISLIKISEIKRVWLRLNDVVDRTDNYLPHYLSQYMYEASSSFRNEFTSQMSLLGAKIEDAISSTSQEVMFEKSSDYLLDLLNLRYLKIIFSILLDGKTHEGLSISKGMELIDKESYQIGSSEFATKIEVKAAQKLGIETTGPNIESLFVKEQVSVICNEIGIMITRSQVNSLKKYKDDFSHRFNVAFGEPNTMLKPEVYSKKPRVSNQTQLYIPSPNDIVAQIKQERQFILSRIVLIVTDMLKESMNSNEEVELSKLTNQLMNYSRFIHQFLFASQKQIKSTWESLESTISYAFFLTMQQHVNLNVYVNSLLERYYNQYNIDLSLKLHNQLLTLVHIRDHEKRIIHEQNKYDKWVSAQYRKKFVEQIKEIKKIQSEEKRKFPHAHAVYFNSAIDAINKYLENMAQIGAKIKCRMDFARQSLEESRIWEEKLNRIKKEEEEEDIRHQKEEEERIQREKLENEQFARKRKMLGMQATEAANKHHEHINVRSESREIENTNPESKAKHEEETSTEVKDEQKEENAPVPTSVEAEASQKTEDTTEPNEVNPESIQAVSEITTENIEPSISSTPDAQTTELKNSTQDPSITPNENIIQSNELVSITQEISPATSAEPMSQDTEDKILENIPLLPVYDVESKTNEHQNFEISQIEIKDDEYTTETDMTVNPPMESTQIPFSPRSTWKRKQKTPKRAPRLFKGRSNANFLVYINMPRETRPPVDKSDIKKCNTLADLNDFDIPVPPRNELFPPKKKGDVSIQDKIEQTKIDNEKLRADILRERVARCLIGVGIRKLYTSSIRKASEEKKDMSIALWRGRRAHEDEVLDLTTELSQCYKSLTEAETQIEKISTEIEGGKIVTSKLQHWKDFTSRKAQQIELQIDSFENTGNINIDKLLKELEEKHTELDALNEEADDFESQFTSDVREPMAQIDTAKRTLVKNSNEFIELRQSLLNNEDAPLPKEYQRDLECFAAENARLRKNNQKIFSQIQELEELLPTLDQNELESTRSLFISKQPPPFVRTTYQSARKPIKKQDMTMKSPFAKYKFKSIIKPG